MGLLQNIGVYLLYVFYQQMKADYWKYIDEFTDGAAKSIAPESARLADQEAHQVAEQGLAVTHTIRLGLALIF